MGNLGAAAEKAGGADPNLPGISIDGVELEPPSVSVALREHILNRLSYGPTPWERQRFDQIGLEKFIELHLTGTIGWLSLPPMDPWPTTFSQLQADVGGDVSIGEARAVMLRVFLERGTTTVRQLGAVLSDFWFNHFNVFAFMGIAKWQLASYLDDALAPHLTGSFEEMLIATARHPAMLQYLDNRKNAAERGFWLKASNEFVLVDPGGGIAVGPNQNFARELMELHTLGVDGGYEQVDVIEAQRILTGWSSNFAGQAADLPAFHDAMHDTGSKVVMGVHFPSDSRTTGEQEVEQFLSWLATHPATAHHLAGKLVRRFVGEDVPVPAVKAVAVALQASSMDIGYALGELFSLPSFQDPQNFRSRFKPPHRLAMSALRSLGVVPSGDQLDELVQELVLLGDKPLYYGPPTGYPDVTGFWLSGSSMLGRFQIARIIANWENVIDAASLAIDPSRMDTKTLAYALIEQILPAGVSFTTLSGIGGHINDGDRSGRLARGLEMIFASPEFARY